MTKNNEIADKPKTTFWSKISLRTKLTSLSVALIALLLAISLAGTVALLKTYLQQNTDNLLLQTGATLVQEDPLTIEERLATSEVTLPPLPSDYYIAFLDPQGRLYLGLVAAASKKIDVPNISSFNIVFVHSTKGIPFTAKVPNAKDQKMEPWRLLALPAADDSGSVVVAIPMAQNDALIDQYQVIGYSFSGLLLFISGLALWLTISSALRPLREVSLAAGRIRKGNLNERLPKIEANTEIAKMNNSLNEMLDSIESSIKSRNQTLERMKRFVADASHELRTPLVTLRGYAELYRKGVIKNKSQVDDAMAKIEAEAIRMSQLVESLLALARLDNDATLNIHRGNIAEVVDGVVKNMKTAHQKATIDVVDLEGKQLKQKIFFNFDEAAMRQVLTNLLNNAYIFAGEKPIEVAIGIVEEKLILEVIDHGSGIPKQLRTKVFERFYRSDNSRNRDTGGSGLGLSIVKLLVEGHQGTIVADETKGGGSTFRITIPNSQKVN
ncbi:MAG: hypothetical protein RIQ88_617 [Actinomycetota bacterium]